MKIAALIPARKNSKRLPGKNKTQINGDFIINKVLNNLNNCSHDIDLFVSSDDVELTEIINVDGVETLDRDVKFNDDYSTVVDLNKWHFSNHLQSYDLVLQTFCHSICIDSSTFDRAIDKIINSPKSSLLTISKLDGPVEWTFKIIDGNIKPNFPNKRNSRSQDLGISFIDSGQFYIYKRVWFEKDEIDEYDTDCDWLEIPNFQSNDLDEEGDIDKLRNNYTLSKSIFDSLA